MLCHIDSVCYYSPLGDVDGFVLGENQFRCVQTLRSVTSFMGSGLNFSSVFLAFAMLGWVYFVHIHFGGKHKHHLIITSSFILSKLHL